MRSSYKLKRNVLLLLSNYLFMWHLNAQFVTLQGNKFKDQNGVDFYPIICNYNIIWAKEGNNYFLMPSTSYGINVQADCGSLSACQQNLIYDFQEMKLMGFNTIRIGINFSKDKFTSPQCLSNVSSPHIYKNKFVLNYQIFPEPNPAASCNGVYSYLGNGEAQRFLDITPPYDFATNPNLQQLLTPLLNVFSIAESLDLKIILITGGGHYLLNDDEYPVYSGNSGIIHERHVDDYAALLIGIAQALKNETVILAYDLWNEPAWHDEEVTHSKTQVCKITSQWYHAIKSVDQNHLITMGLSNFHDVLEWDPAVLKLDFLSEHLYPDTPPFPSEYNFANATHDQVKAKNRYHAELLWLKRNAPLPWVIGETGFSASASSSQLPNHQIHLNGTETEQAQFANFALNESRNAGGSGMSWWQFQDVHWYGVDQGSDYIQNWYGFLRGENPINGNYSTLRKQCATEFLNFVSGSYGSFDQTLNSVYYDPYNFATLNTINTNLIYGNVISTTGQPIQDAVIKAFNWTNTILGTPNDPGDIEHLGKSIYTFSDQNGYYSFKPFNYKNPSDNNLFRIISLQCSALGCNRNDIYSNFNEAITGVQSFLLTQSNFTQANSSLIVQNEIINYDINGYNYLSLISDIIPLGTNNTIQAGKEINIYGDFFVNSGTEVHLFIEKNELHCVDDLINVRNFNPNQVNFIDKPIKDLNEIEIQFKKPGSQLLDAIIQPNPSDGIVYLNVIENTSNEAVDIQVFNTLGQSIKTYHTAENILLLDGIQWQKGVYFIAIKNKNSYLIKKVIIN